LRGRKGRFALTFNAAAEGVFAVIWHQEMSGMKRFAECPLFTRPMFRERGPQQQHGKDDDDSYRKVAEGGP
jgi:hypothetical protein